MPSNADLLFELQRRVVLFRPGTVMPDGSSLGFDGNPNSITAIDVGSRTPGEILIYACPINSRYGESDGTQWYKKEVPNVWKKFIDSDALEEILIGNNESKTHKETIVGYGITTDFIVNHELDSEDVIVQVVDKSTRQVAYPSVELTDNDNVTIKFSFPPEDETSNGADDNEKYVVRIISL